MVYIPIMAVSAPTHLERGSSDLREAILEAAGQCFADKGYAATSMREVAALAACTKPALYYYFESKAALFLAVIKAHNDRIHAILETTYAESGTVRERLQRAAETYFEHVRAHPIAQRIFLRSEVNPDAGQPTFDWKSVRTTVMDRTRRLLEEGVDSGEISAQVDLDNTLYALMGIIDFRCMLWVLQGEPIPKDCAARSLDLLFGGISP